MSATLCCATADGAINGPLEPTPSPTAATCVLPTNGHGAGPSEGLLAGLTGWLPAAATQTAEAILISSSGERPLGGDHGDISQRIAGQRGNMPELLNVVIDISHHNGNVNLAKAKQDGILGVIHKATQGQTFKDPTYRRNRQSAKDAGLLWGAYHFGTGSDGLKQAQHFLAVVGNEPGTLLAPSTSSRTPQGQAWTSRRRARSSPASTRKRGGSRAFTRGTTSSSCWGPAPIRC